MADNAPTSQADNGGNREGERVIAENDAVRVVERADGRTNVTIRQPTVLAIALPALVIGLVLGLLFGAAL